MKSIIAYFAQIYGQTHDAAYWCDGQLLKDPTSEQAKRIETLYHEVSSTEPVHESSTLTMWVVGYRFAARIRQEPKPDHQRIRFVMMVDVRQSPTLLTPTKLALAVASLKEGIKELQVDVSEVTLFELSSALPRSLEKKKQNLSPRTLGMFLNVVLSALILVVMLINGQYKDSRRQFVLFLTGCLIGTNLLLLGKERYSKGWTSEIDEQ